MPDGLLSGVLFVSVVAAFLVSAVFILWQMADERMRAKAQREEAEERRVLEERASMLEKQATGLRDALTLMSLRRQSTVVRGALPALSEKQLGGVYEALEEEAGALEDEASELRASARASEAEGARRLSKPSEAEGASLASNDGADAEEKGVGALASGRAARTSVPWRRAASSIVVTRPIVEEDEGAAANEPATRPRCNTTHV